MADKLRLQAGMLIKVLDFDLWYSDVPSGTNKLSGVTSKIAIHPENHNYDTMAYSGGDKFCFITDEGKLLRDEYNDLIWIDNIDLDLKNIEICIEGDGVLDHGQ